MRLAKSRKLLLEPEEEPKMRNFSKSGKHLLVPKRALKIRNL